MSAPGFFEGFRQPFRGIGFVARNPGLVRIWGWPVAIVFGLWTLGCVAAVWGSMLYANSHVDVDAAAPGLESGVASLKYMLTRVITTMVGMAGATLAAVLLSPIVAAPFNERMGEVVEEREFGVPPPDFSAGKLVRDTARTVRLEVLKLAVYLAVVTPIWVLGLFLGPLSVVSTALSLGLTFLYFALDYVDGPLTRRDVSVRERVRLLMRHPAPMLGFGLGVWLLLLVPFVQLFFMPAAVVGGTRLCHRLGLIAATPRAPDATPPTEPAA